VSSETDREHEAPAARLRVIEGMKAEPDSQRRRKFVDKNERPAHRQLRRITVPTWLPWVAKLLEPITAPPIAGQGEARGGTVLSWRSGGLAALVCLVSGFLIGALLWHARAKPSGTSEPESGVAPPAPRLKSASR
jgi:hypothetical protein